MSYIFGRTRRSKAAMDALIVKMHDLNRQGTPRAEIARQCQCKPGQVTKHLGALRRWKDRRVPRETISENKNALAK